MVTLERLKEVLKYEPETGLFYWKVALGKRVKVGDQAGCKLTSGYIQIMIDNIRYRAHRLAWFHTHGSWPAADIDHINRVRYDNRIINLRDVNKSVNMQNLSTSYIGSKHKVIDGLLPRRKFRVRIRVNGKQKQIGYYNTQEDAYQAYIEAKRKFHEGMVM